MDIHAWTLITDNPIVLDFSRCKYVRDIHDTLAAGFGFPMHYGRNLSALMDCMRDFSCARDDEVMVEIHGIHKMPRDLQEYFEGIMTVFGDVHYEYPNMNFVVKS